MNTFREVYSFENTIFNKEQLGYYDRYFHEYYHDRFRSGQGTEVILDVLKRHKKSGRWMDVGSGPSTLFWSLMLEDICELHCTEICVEGLKVLEDFLVSDEVPSCYEDVMEVYGISSKKLKIVRGISRRYFLFDALRPWPNSLERESYDLITVFGVFGLSKTAEEYQKNFSFMKPFLKRAGVVIGANWVRSQRFIQQGNMDNRYLSLKLVEKAASDYGYTVLHLSEEVILGDPNYDRVVIWALKNEL